MPALFFNPFKSRDKYFLVCKIATLLFCIPWPLTILASVMSLAGEFRADTPMFLRVLIRLGWLLALVYPLVFFALLFFAEKVLAPKYYVVGAVVALLPIAFSVFVLVEVMT